MRDPLAHTEFRVITPKFRPGDRAYQALENLPHALRADPVVILGYALMPPGWKSGGSRPHDLRNATPLPAYITSESWNPVFEEFLFLSEEEHAKVHAGAIAESAAKKAEENRQARIKKYKAAKQVVTDFEAEYFAALPTELS